MNDSGIWLLEASDVQRWAGHRLVLPENDIAPTNSAGLRSLDTQHRNILEFFPISFILKETMDRRRETGVLFFFSF